MTSLRPAQVLRAVGLLAALSLAAVTATGLPGSSGGRHDPGTRGSGHVVANVPAAQTANLTMGPEAMNGNVKAGPGDQLEVGYDLSFTGAHPVTTVYVTQAQVTFAAVCQTSKSGPGGTITVPIPDSSPGYLDALNSTAWLPSANQNSALTYQGSRPVPNLCGGDVVSLKAGGTFTALVQAKDTTDPVSVRWHYRVAGKGGAWSSVARVQAAYPSGSFTLSGSLGALVIGDPHARLPLTIGNPNPFAIDITAASAAVTDVPTGCQAGWLTTTPYAYASPAPVVTVAAQSTTSTALSLPILFADSTTADQTGCLGKPYTLTYTGTAQADGP